MLKNEYEKFAHQMVQCSRNKNWKKLGYFNEVIITSKEWSMINELNQELRVRIF